MDKGFTLHVEQAGAGFGAFLEWTQAAEDVFTLGEGPTIEAALLEASETLLAIQGQVVDRLAIAMHREK